ncbi:hypothetical protein H257_07461 [Aphanomyces astaci]|uniref:Uncharacterized protein n=1 Tax=Aphanomyces astaci TaxID=112090 RepID=W4GIB8_APHAT|nr:hypothetical protein H257_07461 [Aphanomyces astaci]ETV79460.1 hypothetical protein H257_07461 [Aphanomyces astaci]|eukprot:XP_009831301.1 hypothetical protein H257_07461 [Aphanomyces astaci]
MYWTNHHHIRRFTNLAGDSMHVHVSTRWSFVIVQRTIDADMTRVANALWQATLGLKALTKTLARVCTVG